MNRLYRSKEHKVFGGVCGGLGEYFDLDPVLIRIALVVLGFASAGLVVLGYIIAWIAIPDRADNAHVEISSDTSSTWKRFLPGLFLICIGGFMLIREFCYWFSWSEFGPIILIGFGAFLILRKVPNKTENRSTADTNSNNHNYNGSNAS